MSYKLWTTAGYSDYFEVPSDCHLIWVTGCGGGGGGQGSNASATGGNGGCASPCVIRLPLAVVPNGIIGIYVGVGGAGGTAANGAAANTATFSRVTTIAGQGIISPLTTPDRRIFTIGCGGESSVVSPMIPALTDSGYVANECIVYNISTPPGWAYTGGGYPLLGLAVSGKDAGKAGGVNPNTYNKAGVTAFNGNGFGHAQASDATYGSGGPGGGGPFGRGGTGGQYSGGSPANGGNGSGYGAGGGGSSGRAAGSGVGGDGSGGFLLFEW